MKKNTDAAIEYIERVKKERKKHGLTQQDMANKLNISLQKYSRFETGKLKSFDSELTQKIKTELGIFYEDYASNEVSTMKTLRIPNALLNELLLLQHYYDFETFTEAIIYFLSDYVNDFHLRKCIYSIQDVIEETIANSYKKTLKEIHRESEMNEKILDKIREEKRIDVDKMRDEIKQEIFNKLHAKK